MYTEPVVNRMQITKTIYAKRKAKKFDAKWVSGVLSLEAETHVRNNPDLEYDKVSEPVKNSDLSHTYTIFFKKIVGVTEAAMPRG